MFRTIHECRLDLVSFTVNRVHPDDDLGGDTNDFMPCSAARVSFGNEDKTGQDIEKDRKLMKYLADHKHMTPFEYQHATFLIECPLFIRSQIHRHRTFSFNEISRRYTDENLEFWIPDKFRGQATNNKQASSDEVITVMKPKASYEDPYAEIPLDPMKCYKSSCYIGLNTYTDLLEAGVAREIARAVLPQSLLTRFYMTGNLRNWQHFLELRRGDGSQKEVAVIADRIAEKLREVWPNSCEVLGV